MDKLRIQLVNRDLNQKTAVELLRKLCYVTLKSNDFLIIGKENKEGFSYFSTMDSFMNKWVSFCYKKLEILMNLLIFFFFIEFLSNFVNFVNFMNFMNFFNFFIKFYYFLNFNFF